VYRKEVAMKGINKTTLRVLYVCGVITVSMAATAVTAAENKSQESAFELGLGAGGGQLDLSVPGASGSLTLYGGAYTGFVGYRLNRWVAVEASYLEAGSFTKATSQELFKVDPHMVTATAMGSLPITPTFSLYGRAGLAHWWYTTEIGFADIGVASVEGKSNELIWGGGMSLFIDRALLRLEYLQSKATPDFGGVPLDFKVHDLMLSVAWLL